MTAEKNQIVYAHPTAVQRFIRGGLLGVCVLLLMLALQLLFHGHTDNAAVMKRAEIERLMRLTHFESVPEQMKARFFATLRTEKLAPDIVLDDIERKADTTFVIRLQADLYYKYFSLEDLRAANHFFSTPSGLRVAQIIPKMRIEGGSYDKYLSVEDGHDLEAFLSTEAGRNMRRAMSAIRNKGEGIAIEWRRSIMEQIRTNGAMTGRSEERKQSPSPRLLQPRSELGSGGAG